MTLYRGKLETVEAFHYEAALETMDFKYPFPDWLIKWLEAERMLFFSLILIPAWCG